MRRRDGDVEIEPVAGCDLEAVGRQRPRRVVSVDRDHLGVELGEVGREDAPVGDVQQPQTNPLAGRDHQLLVGPAVHRDDVAPAPVVGEVVAGVELRVDLAAVGEQPVVEHPEHVAGVRRRMGIVDDQHAEEAALDLLARAHVGMEPERAGVLRRELVDEGLARLDRRLRHVRHPVHRVRHAHAVPVDRRRLRQVVREADAHRLAEAHAQRRAGHLAVVRPDAKRPPVDERDLARARRGC